MKKQYIIIISLIALAFVVTAILYAKLPPLVASHWNAEGIVDGYMSKQSHTVFFLSLIVGLPLLITFIPKLDPKYQNIREFQGPFEWFIVALSAFFDALYFFSLAWALGYQFPINYFIIPTMSLLFFTIGIMLKYAKPNYSIGIRTPWTLASDENWTKTHELSAKAYQYGSAFLLVSLLFGKYSFVVFIAAIMIMSFYPVVYSYLLFKRKQT